MSRPLKTSRKTQKRLNPETVAIVGEAITEAVCSRFMEWNTGRKGIKAPLGLDRLFTRKSLEFRRTGLTYENPRH